MPTELPGEWGEVDPRYPFQERRFHNRSSEEYVVVEGKTEPWHDEDEPPTLRAHLIGENFEDDPEPIATIIESSKDFDEVLQAAFEWMKEHPEGGAG